jgi:hypothetical protein
LVGPNLRAPEGLADGLFDVAAFNALAWALAGQPGDVKTGRLGQSLGYWRDAKRPGRHNRRGGGRIAFR